MKPELKRISSCETCEEEFWYHVSSQDELPLAAAKPKPEIAKTLDAFLLRFKASGSSIADFIAKSLEENPSLLHELRALISLSDKRLYLDLSYLFSRILHGQNTTLCGCKPSKLTRHQTSFFVKLMQKDATKFAACEAISKYLVGKGLQEILTAYAAITPEQRSAIMSCLIAPKEVQQLEAKLRGHGPEAKLADILEQLGLSVLPKDKARNPMAAHDPNVDMKTLKITDRNRDSTFSTDIVVTNSEGSPLICIVSLVHSSDPGQFGVDKANTVAEIKESITKFNKLNSGRTVELWGLVDGVGYSENKSGTINAMLPHFDCFIQLKSMWKAPLQAHRLGLIHVKTIKFNELFYSCRIIKDLQKYVPDGVKILDEEQSSKKSVTIIASGTTLTLAKA